MSVLEGKLSPELIFKRSDIFMALGIVSIILSMIIPVPPFMLDILLTFNICFSLIILLVSMYVGNPLDFSAFPSLLLIATLFRLSLNIASTRLILLRGDEGPLAAGHVINSFGRFLISGNYIVGFVIFIILVVINFVVITKGAGRIAEVAARFTLDAMPGKQMSIDADLNAGLITEEEARRRRAEIAREADFYGAMDGASKFVRGDAIASVVIMLINIVGGLVIGVLQKGMPLSKAAKTYTVLTVGDGLVSQIPALIVSTAAGIIISRAASEENLGYDLVKQIFNHPKAIMAASCILLFFSFMPGLPHIPFLILSVASGTLGYMIHVSRSRQPEVVEEPVSAEPETVEVPPLDPISLEIGYRLIKIADPSQGGDLLERIKMLRKKYAQEMGFILPPVRVKDNLQLNPNEYRILVKGVEVGRGELLIGYHMAINPGTVKEKLKGIETKEPVFNLPAVWIPDSEVKRARALGYTVVDPVTVLITHFTEVVKKHFHELLDRQEVQNLLDSLRKTHPKVVDDLIPSQLSLGTVQKVLQNLLREHVPIRDLVTILETLGDYAQTIKDPDILTEYVRERLSRFIVKDIVTKDGSIPVVVLSQDLEKIMREHLNEEAGYIALPPDILATFSSKVGDALKSMAMQGLTPTVLCSPSIRRFVKRLLDQVLSGLDVIVLSYNEIPPDLKVKTVKVVGLDHEN